VSVPAVPQIGERIRAERVGKGLSLRSLARAVGLSPSLISQIETGKCQPSVSTLYAITTALGISVEDVFEAPEVTAPGPVAVTPAAGDPAGVLPVAALRAVPAGSPRPGTATLAGPVVCPDDREVLELDSGVTWERLGHVPGARVDFLLVTYAPGGCSSSTGQLMRHAGIEYGYLVEGELMLTLGFDTFSLAPGEAVSFPSATPHRYRNEGDVPSLGIWFVTEPDTP
jgi:DNA-binding XRE family transcriptional regulator/quercetin dioxygenase-like cupin family protein